MNFLSSLVQGEILRLFERALVFAFASLKVQNPDAGSKNLRTLLSDAEQSGNESLNLLAREIRDRLSLIMDTTEDLNGYQLENFSKHLEYYINDFANLHQYDEAEVTDFLLALPYNIEKDLSNYILELQNHVKRRRDKVVVVSQEVAHSATSFSLYLN